MVAVIDGFRWCLLKGEQKLDFRMMSISVAVSILFLIIGLGKFRQMEKSFADII